MFGGGNPSASMLRDNSGWPFTALPVHQKGGGANQKTITFDMASTPHACKNCGEFISLRESSARSDQTGRKSNRDLMDRGGARRALRGFGWGAIAGPCGGGCAMFGGGMREEGSVAC